jgi:cyclic-di-AMP phosphodiesterase PgpH
MKKCVPEEFLVQFIRNIISRQKMIKKGLIGSRKRRTGESPLAQAADSSRSLGLVVLLLLWVFLVAMLAFPARKNDSLHIDFVIKQRATKIVYAHFAFEYVDRVATEKEQKRASAAVPLYFSIDPEANKEIEQRAKDFINYVELRFEEQKKGRVFNPAFKSEMAKLAHGLPDQVSKTFYYVAQDNSQRKLLQSALKRELSKGIVSVRLKSACKVGQQVRVIDVKGRDRMPKPAVEMVTPSEAAAVIANQTLKYYSAANRKDMLKGFQKVFARIVGIEGNLKLNEDLYRSKCLAAAGAVKPVVIEIRQHQPIIAHNQIINQQDLDLLHEYKSKWEERHTNDEQPRRMAKAVVLSLLLIVFIGLYIYQIHPEVVSSNRKILLISAIIVICVLHCNLTIRSFPFYSGEFSIPPQLMTDALPLATAGILLSVLLGLRIAIYVGLFVSMIVAMMLGFDFFVAVEGIVVSCIAALAVRRATNYRSFFIRIAVAVFVTSLLLDYTLAFKAAENPQIVAKAVGVVAAASLITAIFSLLLTFAFEMFFGVSTNMSLLLMCDYNHPLLKRLQLEAPGTFHHSLMVSTLAEYAANAIGANPIKARVGALFHDIGKLTKPEYFVENNTESHEKHKELHPRISSMVILNHVKDGIDLAVKYKLRRDIRAAIERHHGTDIVLFFYHRALEESKEKGGSVEEQEYRYKGPLPHDKEVVIISLADACEAAARSLLKPTHSKIETLVWEIFRKRIRDRQLDEAEITFAELAQIRDSFVKTLTTMHHSRISYPKDEPDENDLFAAAEKNVAAEPKNDKKDGDKGD